MICLSDLKNQQGWANGPALNKQQQQNELQIINIIIYNGRQQRNDTKTFLEMGWR